jgi:hypothetical protein
MVRESALSIVALALLGCGTAVGQEAPTVGQSSSGNQEGEVRRARVTIDGDSLFSVRGMTAYPAERRAREIAAKIHTVAANRSVEANSLTLEQHDTSTWIMGGGQRIMAVLDEDAVLEETSRDRLAEVYRARN